MFDWDQRDYERPCEDQSSVFEDTKGADETSSSYLLVVLRT